MDKIAVLEAVTTHLRRELDELEAAMRAAQHEATGAESKAENKYDTRSLEASYLARGQAERVVALRRVVGVLRIVDPRPRGADAPLGQLGLAELEGSDHTRWVLLVPDGGGRRVQVGDVEVLLVSPRSPAGKGLLGAVEGDEVALGARSYEVVSTC